MPSLPQSCRRRCLTITLERDLLVSLPRPTLRGARLVIVVSFSAEAAVLATGRGETTDLTMLMDGIADPVDAGIVTNNLVHGIHHDHLIVLVD